MARRKNPSRRAWVGGRVRVAPPILANVLRRAGAHARCRHSTRPTSATMGQLRKIATTGV